MGPRLFDGEGQWAKLRRMQPTQRFNGAPSLRRGRGLHTCPVADCVRPSFNGAPSLRRGRGRALEADMAGLTKLQWGPVSSTGKGTNTQARYPNRGTLQWGPVSSTGKGETFPVGEVDF